MLFQVVGFFIIVYNAHALTIAGIEAFRKKFDEFIPQVEQFL